VIFIDASFYLSVLLRDDNYPIASQKYERLNPLDCVTSQAVLGEVLTVGSMQFDRLLSIKFVTSIMSSGTLVVIENPALIYDTWTNFREIKKKDVGWVDCYTLVIMKQYSVTDMLSFDLTLLKLANSKPIS